MFDTLVVGAGQAGLAAGYHLRRAGLGFVILEAGPGPAGSWPSYYDSLKLFSPARYCSLPGLPFPGDPDHYPLRDEVIAYLASYSAHFGLPVVTGARVVRVEREGKAFRVVTAGGKVYSARTLIAATGAFSRPYLPRLPGQEEFRGRILHSAGYRNPAPFRNQRVVVVGAGNSAVQIGVEVAEVARVTLATREAVRFVPQRILGRDIHFWLRASGVDTLPLGYWLSVGRSRGGLDTGGYRHALAAGRPDQQPMFTRFTPDGVVWADGRREAVDSIIFATGYLPNLGYLAGLGALDADGHPRHRGGISRTTPGLCYVGLIGQRSHASATLRGVGPDAAHVVEHVRRELRRLS